MKSKKNKRILITVLILVMFTGVYIGIHIHRNNVENRAREVELRMMESAIISRIHYAGDMFFDHKFSDISNFRTLDDPFNTRFLMIEFSQGQREINEIVFVNSEEEAEGFGEDVLVFWPTEWSELFLEFINGWLDPESPGHLQHLNDVVDTEGLNIELPLTRELMVTDWELMIEIRERLGWEEGMSMSNDTRIRGFVETRVNQALRHGNEIVDTDEPTEDND